METSCSHSNYSFHYNHSYFIQASVPLPSVIAIGNLQFNKTLHSVTYIDCKLYTCLNSSVSLKNESLLILQSRHNLWLPVNLQQPWEEDPMAGLASYLLTKSLQGSKRLICWLILGILGLIAICHCHRHCFTNLNSNTKFYSKLDQRCSYYVGHSGSGRWENSR